jgi:hypothetical protein
VGGGVPAPDEPKAEGLWRIASPRDRMTLTKDPGGAGFMRAPYSGHLKQQWRFLAAEDGRYQMALELAKDDASKCLRASPEGAGLAPCDDQSLWTLREMRASTVERPGRYRLESSDGTCLLLEAVPGPALGECTEYADIYVEPVGYGERHRESEYEVRALLLEKPTTSLPGHPTATIDPLVLESAAISFNEHVAVWFERMTDGRVTWTAETVVAELPITSLIEEGGNFLPSAATLPADVAAFVPRGKYDNVTVFFTGGDVPGGWGWGPGPSVESNFTLWATVNGGATNSSEWVSWEHEPTEVFIHEPMHGFDQYAELYGIPLPYQLLHGAEANIYAREEDGYMPWYRDYWLGTVIGEDDTYRGFGPRLFQKVPPREWALMR